MRSMVIVTARCPVDGPVAITALDIDEVVVRSGSDVRVTIRCPECGSILQFTSNPEPSLLHWAVAALKAAAAVEAECLDEVGECVPIEHLPPAMEAYLEYFRRELSATDTVEQMLVLMDLSEQCDRSIAAWAR